MFQMKFCISLSFFMCMCTVRQPSLPPNRGICEEEPGQILLKIPPGKCAYKYLSSQLTNSLTDLSKAQKERNAGNCTKKNIGIFVK